MGPLTEAFRKSDSTWSLATPSELNAGLKWWKQMHDDGLAEEFVLEREKLRAISG